MKVIVFLYLAINSFALAQTDWHKWEAKNISYRLPIMTELRIQNENKSVTKTILNSLKNLYSLTISNYDGDNCPFSPSCSEFFVEAVEQTNIFTGFLIFADRFTRDMNFLKDNNHYTLHKNGKYFDPPSDYTFYKEER